MGVGLSVGLACGIGVGIGSDEYVPTVAATVATADLSGNTSGIATNGTNWTATLTWQQLGVIGNGKILDVRFDVGPSSAEIRDNERHNGTTWIAAAGTVGVWISSDIGDPLTVGTIEAAINASSTLAQVTTADASPSKEVDYSLMDATSNSATFSGGV